MGLATLVLAPSQSGTASRAPCEPRELAEGPAPAVPPHFAPPPPPLAVDLPGAGRLGLGLATAAIGVGHLVVMGLVYLLPSEVSLWDRDEKGSMGEDWLAGFRRGPVWDHDWWYFNWVAHPLAGAEYYLVARNRGLGPWWSFVYGAALSAAFEYGVENLMEHPSATDLYVTPLTGALFGELRYQLKVALRAGDAAWWRTLLLVVLDPLDALLGGL